MRRNENKQTRIKQWHLQVQKKVNKNHETWVECNLSDIDDFYTMYMLLYKV